MNRVIIINVTIFFIIMGNGWVCGMRVLKVIIFRKIRDCLSGAESGQAVSPVKCQTLDLPACPLLGIAICWGAYSIRAFASVSFFNNVQFLYNGNKTTEEQMSNIHVRNPDLLLKVFCQSVHIFTGFEDVLNFKFLTKSF